MPVARNRFRLVVPHLADCQPGARCALQGADADEPVASDVVGASKTRRSVARMALPTDGLADFVTSPCASDLAPHNGLVQDWLELKELIAASSGLDRGTLRVIASVPVQVGLALVFRRPITSVLPWLALLALTLGNEAADALADELLEDWETRASLRDLVLTMVLPTFLLLAFRIRSLRPATVESRSAIRLVPVRPPQPDPIVDAEFEEVG